ncbi:MAG TPA: tRNA lysidine(34) synthetase TilS [Pyrinomonadaceae bacterium]|nr:tRNA lysidine(34) synthetase TilS [Pyrinomonadaceae bacterium]
MHRFERQLITEWRRLALPTDQTVIVAVSGGADSAALLIAFANLFKRKKFSGSLIAAHLDHGLRDKESDGDREAVGNLAEKLGVGFVCERAAISTKGNLEQNARNARYKFLVEVARRSSSLIIVTGHTMNDQAETLLMNLVRGSGPDGLAAMPSIKPISADPRVSLVRPLLSWALREDTENYCREMGYEFRIDSMNLDPAFRRVRIRREVLPLLAELNPKIVQTLAATSQLFSTIETSNIQHNVEDELSISSLRDSDSRSRLDSIRAWLASKRGTKRQLALKHIQAVERLALSEKSGRVAELPGKARVVRSRGRLRYEEN